MRQVLGRRQGPGDEPGQFTAVEAAQLPPGAEPQLAVNVPEVRAVADDLLVQSAASSPPEAVTPGAVEVDRQQ